ncbi:MAG: peptidyl-prolyl cis-trans isomerase [Fimbriimonadales bacterium]|nr:peptidyl-prolyl cis-trans isomerase [Fimbriimonadales bacterium]
MSGRLVGCILLMTAILAGAWAQDVVAEVGTERITRAELVERLIAQSGAAVLEELIAERLLLQAARQKGVSVSDSEVDARIQILQQNAGGAQAFNQLAASLGFTPKLLRERLRTQILAEKTLGLTVSDEEIQRYFELNRPRLDIPAQVKLRRVVCETEAKAKQAHERLKRGDPIARVAAEMSDYPDVRANQGEFGVWRQNAGVDAVIESRAFKLQRGQFTEPFAYGSDFYILYAEEVTPAQSATLENSRERIRVILLTEKWQAAYPAWIAEQRRTATVKVLLKTE